MGYITLDRSLQAHDLWLSEPFSRGQAWVDLLFLANYKPGMMRRRGIPVKVQRGQVGYSQDALAARWRWSEGKVKRFLAELKEADAITVETALKNVAVTALITITNYDRYQSGGPENGPEDEPVNGWKTDPKTDPEQEVKKEKKEKKEKPTPPKPPKGERDALFDEFWQAYPRKVKKDLARKAWEKRKVDPALLAEMLQAIEQQKQTEQWQTNKYIPYPATWLNDGQWEDEVDIRAGSYGSNSPLGPVRYDGPIYKF